MNPKRIALIVLGLVALLVLIASGYSVRETDVVILTQFGKQIGKPVTEAGLHFKPPFIQSVNRIEKRLLEWDGPVERDADEGQDCTSPSIRSRAGGFTIRRVFREPAR